MEHVEASGFMMCKERVDKEWKKACEDLASGQAAVTRAQIKEDRLQPCIFCCKLAGGFRGGCGHSG